MSRRIAFVTNMCPPYRQPLFEMLAERFDVDYFFFSDGRERYWSQYRHHGAPGLRALPLRRWRLGGHVVTPDLPLRLRAGGYEAVVKCLNGRLMVPLTVASARLLGLPLVMWTGMWHHPRTPFHRITRGFTEWVYREADAIVTYGDHVKRFVGAVTGVNPAKIYVAGQAVDPTPFSAVRRSASNGTRALFIGQLEERKGVRDLVNAVGLSPDIPLTMSFAGGGSLEPWLRREANHDKRLDVLGDVAHEQLPGLLARTSFVVLPSVTTGADRETWGLVVNEAMHAGVPVIATDAVGAAAGGLVRDGVNGRVVREGDVRALANAIGDLAGDLAATAALGEAARTAAAEFTFERMADAFVFAVDHAVGARSVPGGRQR